MKIKNKLFGIPTLIIVIFVVVAVMGGVYIVKNVEFGIDGSESSRLSKIEDTGVAKSEISSISSIQNNDIALNLSEKAQEVFKGQPGYIKSIVKKRENLWVLGVDFVTQNPKYRLWGTEGFSSREPLYINKNPKIRNFNVTDKTKLGRCSFRKEDIVDIKDFMENAQELVSKNLEVAYSFSTNGSEAVSILIICVS